MSAQNIPMQDAQQTGMAARAHAAPDAETEKEWVRKEMAIARKYQQGFPVIMAVWGFANLFCWLALWPLVFSGIVPLWLGFLVACANVSLCYLPSHEAQHSNYAAPGQPLRWLNELIGYLSTIPLVLPFKTARITHMDHHTYTNDPEKDPDYETRADQWWHILLKGLQRKGATDGYGQVLSLKAQAGDESAHRAILEGAVQNISFWGILAALAWSGHALEAALLWWLPRHIGITYITLFLSWFPHHPMEEQGRYRDTRGFHTWLGNFVALGMEHHIVHHLHPGIPLTRNAAAFREMRPILVARNCRLHNI